jgi:mRNA interferase MazF
MKRGEIWTVSGGTGYAGKPRPAVIVQSDEFEETFSLTICGFTRDETAAPLFRLPIEPNERNGLRHACRLMVDKVMTVPKDKVGRRVGVLDDDDVLRMNRALIVFLGLGSKSRSRRSPVAGGRLSTAQMRPTR